MDLAAREAVFDKDVELVDLRLPGKTIVRLRQPNGDASLAQKTANTGQ